METLTLSGVQGAAGFQPLAAGGPFPRGTRRAGAVTGRFRAGSWVVGRLGRSQSWLWTVSRPAAGDKLGSRASVGSGVDQEARR